MSPPSGTKRARYGTRQLIQKVFLDPANAAGLKTSELISRVQSASGAGSRIPGATIFQAARSLVKKKVLEAKRDGREFRFKMAAMLEPKSAPSPSEGQVSSAPLEAAGLGPVPVSAALSEEVRSPASLPVTSLPHRLDPGQMLVLKHDEKEIVTLTNVHGKAVIERHPL